jgi:putative tricarboxylic transport membrane protein
LNQTIKSLLFLLVLYSGIFNNLNAAYPDDKPIKIIVHTKPGGAVDLMARQIAQIASKYTDQSLVVINKPGGSGLLALANVYNSKADGYTLLAFPAAFLAPIQTTDIGFTLDDFHYITCMTISPEAIITSKKSDIVTLEQVLKNAKSNPGKQKWCGPGSGTLDHLMAVKIWDKSGITSKWIPYGGGGPAIAAVMGNHADVYVGNPEDILGREDNLVIAAIASEDRHPNFPETPTFKEYNIDLVNEVMWRGFAVKKGTDKEAIDYLENLLYQCSQDPKWHSFLERTMVQGVFLRNGEFTELVKKDALSSQEYLKMAGFKIGSVPESAPMPILFFLGVICILLVTVVIISKYKKITLVGTIFIAVTGLSVAVLFYYMSQYFPVPRQNTFVGAATVPQVWIFFLTAMSVIVLINYFRDPLLEKIQSGQVKLVWIIIGLITFYTLLMPIIGFFPSTLIMLIGGMLFMKYKNYWMIMATSVVVVLFMYLVFYKILMVPLPMGSLF